MKMNILLINDERIKFDLINYLLSTADNLIYIDLDLLTSGYIKSNFIKPKSKLNLFIPTSLQDLKTLLIDLCCKCKDESIVMDSLDTFKILYGGHLLNIYLSILYMHIKRLEAKFIGISRKNFIFDNISEVILDVDKKRIIKHKDKSIEGLEFYYY